MTQEEKAKAYDEAIEKAKKIHNEHKAQPFDVMLRVFPEIAESEGERIRKELLAFCKNRAEKYSNDPKYKNISAWIAWLEKQGEHANFRNKIQIGDKVTRNEDGVLVNLSQLNRVAKKQGEQKPADKVEPKFKVGDEIKTSNEESLTITKIDEKGYWSEDLFICGFDEECCWDLVEQKPAWSEEDEQYLLVCKNALAKYQTTDKWDATIISRWLEDKLESLKDRVQPQPKQEWSEEDEYYYNIIQYILNNECVGKTDKENAINWFKSLKDRYTWKPSDEHIHWLKWAINRMPDTEKANEAEAVLEELLEQLKKLREE